LRERFAGVSEAKMVNSAAAADVCLVAPLGADVATAVERGGLPAERTVAVDGLFFADAAVTLMTSAATTERARSLAGALVAAASLKAHWIGDSAGFVAQRVVGMMIHLACEIAQQRIAAPADIDLAVKLALGYPKGPFEWCRALGPARVLALMQQIFAATGDSRYRPSQWLRRRVQLGIELDVVE
jgi:3-hydroxybutyryl-CoA dehydrogenase